MIFINNKYTNYYYNIVDAAKARNLTSRAEANSVLGYAEQHHIIPESLNGSDNKSNLIYLTPREHFICHWLLIKMTEGENRNKMLFALNMMRCTSPNHKQRYNTKITSRVYATYKQEVAGLVGKQRKGKTWEQIYGADKAAELKYNLTGKTYNRRTPYSAASHYKFDNTEYKFYNVKTGELLYCTKYSFRQMFNLKHPKLFNIVNHGKQWQGWQVLYN